MHGKIKLELIIQKQNNVMQRLNNVLTDICRSVVSIKKNSIIISFEKLITFNVFNSYSINYILILTSKKFMK